MMRYWMLLMTMFTAASVQAAIKVERVEYKHGETVLEGVLAYDDAAAGKRPGVAVCPEWWGCNDYAESRARQLAEAGYVAFAIDMYGKGKTTKDGKQAGEWSSAVMKDLEQMRQRAASGLKVLADNSRVDSGNLAVIGYCMGGTVALELARSGLAHTGDLKAVVAFHASTIAAREGHEGDNNNIKGTVLVCHGQADDFVKPDQITSFHKQMADAKVDYAFIAYADAVHAFTNPAADGSFSPSVKYNAKADKRSWQHMHDLFDEVFGKSKMSK